MAAIVTTNLRIHAAKQFLNGFSDPTQNLYLFIGRTLPWLDDNSPPTPVDCENDESSAYREMLSLKRLSSITSGATNTPATVSLVAPRYSWTALNNSVQVGGSNPGFVYTQYQHDIDLFNPTSGLPPFYTITDSLNVYKCLNNNLGAGSTVMPTGTSTTPITLSDGYTWKYMFTVSSADVLAYVTNEWIPVRTLTANDGSNQWLVQHAAVPGTIDRIDMLTAGTQYTSVPDVQIVGDGTGATATAIISNGNVTGIHVTATGQNYTWARVNILNGGVAANGATAKAIVSPFGGHGSDPVTELGASWVLVDCKLAYDENGTFTVTNDFRRIGVVKNPLLNDGVTAATATDYCQAWRFTLGTISGTSFVPDETVTGSTSGATGVVMDFNSTTRVLRLVQVSGTFIPGDTIVGSVASGTLQTMTGTATGGSTTTIVLPNSASATDQYYNGQTVRLTGGPGAGQIAKITGYAGLTRTATVSPTFLVSPTSSTTFVMGNIVQPDIQAFSGSILYMENRRPIARSSDQVEDIKISFEF